MHFDSGHRVFFRAFAITATLLFGLASSALLYAGHHKVDVCHVDEYGTYQMVSIAESALPAHVGHGDSFPGDIVPGSGGQLSLADDCTLIPGCPCLVDLPADWMPLFGISGTIIEFCDDGTTVSDVFGSWFDDNDDALGFFKDEQCDSPTIYGCSAGGITRDISEAQFVICSSGIFAP